MFKISTPNTQVDVLHNRKDRSDSRMRTFEDKIKDNMTVTCRENFNEYLYNSSLHGLRYVGDRTISRWERMFFACMFLIVVVSSIYFISSIWMKWSASPLIITLSSAPTSIKDLPFPAVTICNMNQVRKSAVLNISNSSAEFSVVQSLCRYGISHGNDSAPDSVAWPLYRKVLLEVAPSCSNMLLHCEFGPEPFACETRFRKILTDDGVCFIFNGAHRTILIKNIFNSTEEQEELLEDELADQIINKWTPETGFESLELKQNENSSPLPAAGSGNEMGLSLILKVDKSDYYCSSTRSYGFKVLLHNPNDLPRVAHYGVAIGNGHESRIVIQPKIMEASKPIRKLSRHIRRCIFENENFLKFYNTYSERNCESECETTIVYRKCNCTAYYMPRSQANQTICGQRESHCVQKVNRELQLKRNSYFSCSHCYSGCFALTYETTFSTAKIFNKDPFLLDNHLETDDVAVVHTYYAMSSFRTQRIEELVGFADFLSNMGGLLGLFMGFSVFSVIEMFYFISIRPYCNYQRLAQRRREIISRIVERVSNLRQKKGSSTFIRTVQTNSVNDKRYPYIH